MARKPIGPRSRPWAWTHGRNCYVNHGCRCDICRHATSEYVRRQRERRPCRLTVDPLTWPELVALELLKQEGR